MPKSPIVWNTIFPGPRVHRRVGLALADAPKYSSSAVFLTLHDTIPLLISTFEEIKDAIDEGKLDAESQKRLTKTVDGCVRLTTLLEDYLNECLPSPNDSFSQKTKKAIKSIRSEKMIGEIQRTLETYKSTLTLYFTHLSALPSPNANPNDAASKHGKYYEVPAMNVQYFVGRKHLLERIENHLQGGEKSNDRSKTAVLLGMGGQGKTQLALEYCRMKRADYSVFFVDATSEGTAFRSFEYIGSTLSPGSNFPNPEIARTFVLKTLEDFLDPVLFVFDNFDQPAEFTTIRDFLPHKAKIIVTTRHGDAKRLGKCIEVGAMSEDEGVELLLHQSGHDRNPDNVKHAREIAEQLGGLALAIDQAATYINARHVPLDRFIEVYSKRRAAILKHTPSHWEYRKTISDEPGQPVSVFTTWEMSFEKLEAHGEERESIIHLLTLGAFIDTNNIGEGLFRVYAHLPYRPSWLEAFMDDENWDTDKYQDTVVRLLSVSLVTSIDLMTTDARFSFHPLIAEWLKLRIDAKTRASYTEEAIKVVRAYVDNGDKVEMDIRNKGETLSHIDKIVEHDQVYHSPKGSKHISHALKEATISFGSFYRRLGRYHETRNLIERAMSDEDVSPAVRNVLANMYCDQGALEKAEKLYDKVLVGLGKEVPKKDPSVKLQGTHYAFIYWTQDDKLTEDGLRYEGAYKGDFHQFDPWFVSVLSTYNGLGVLYMKTGRLDLAESLFNQALSGREKAMGYDDRYTAEIVNHLGALYTRTGNYAKAEELLLRALKYLDKAYGEYYMATQPTGNNLGILYMHQDRLADAAKIITRTTSYLENGFGPVHASTLCAFHNQALLFRKQEKLPDAIALLERTIEGWEESGEGVAKPEADSKFVLADILEGVEKRRREAEGLFMDAAALYEHELGREHPQTREALERAERARVESGKGVGGLSMQGAPPAYVK